MSNAEDLLGGKTEPAAKKTAPTKKAPTKKADATEKAAPATKKAPAKKADAEDLLGGKKAAPAAKKAAPAAKKAEKAEKTERAAKPPVEFAEGEREELLTKVKRMVKKPINSRDLAEKLGIETRKLRAVLYSAQRAGIVVLESGASRVAGMTVSPAAQ